MVDEISRLRLAQAAGLEPAARGAIVLEARTGQADLPIDWETANFGQDVSTTLD